MLNNRGSGSWSDVICGIDWVTAHADTIEVANMSLGGAGADHGNCGNGSDAMHAAICEAVTVGVTFVVAAGNDAQDAAGFTPAAYDEVITVSALADFDGSPGGGAAATCRDDLDDTFADFSNHGADIDLIAPGVCIESTWDRGGYNTISGTSMASPHVAGGAGLYLANNPGASPAGVEQALQSAASEDWNPIDDPDGTQERLLIRRRSGPGRTTRGPTGAGLLCRPHGFSGVLGPARYPARRSQRRSRGADGHISSTDVPRPPPGAWNAALWPVSWRPRSPWCGLCHASPARGSSREEGACVRGQSCQHP